MLLRIKNKKTNIRDYALMGLMLAFGIVLQQADNLLSFGVPGGKLGLANIVSVVNLFVFGAKNAMIISVLRAFLGSVFGGAISSAAYSICGAAASVLVMSFAKKSFYPKISEVGISVCGACTHNLAQLLVACIVFESRALLSYGAVLVLAGIASGLVTGILAAEFDKRIFKMFGK